jgi:hypothetical protein
VPRCGEYKIIPISVFRLIATNRPVDSPEQSEIADMFDAVIRQRFGELIAQAVLGARKLALNELLPRVRWCVYPAPMSIERQKSRT